MAACSSPDVTLATPRFRKGARFIHEYELSIPWRHEIRTEDRLEPDARETYPVCTGGGGACPPEDCGGPESFMACPATIGSRAMRLRTWRPWFRFSSKSR
jgi:hypothetical protein